MEAAEGVEDRGGPGPVGGEVKRVAAGVAGEVAGDVQDPVAQSFGFADSMLVLQAEQLCPDHHVVCAEGELEPRGVGVEAVEGQIAGPR